MRNLIDILDFTTEEIDELVKLGAVDGDTIKLYGHEFEYYAD